MKEYVQAVVVFAIFLMLIPSIVFLSPTVKSREASIEQVSSQTDDSKVKILFTKDNTIKEYTMEEYMTGAVLSQMPYDFDEKALEAQAVLAHTYAQYRRLSEEKSPTKALDGADLSDNAMLYQGFFTTEQAKDFYKDEYEKAYNKVLKAVKSAGNKILTYNNEPVIVAFHGISNGYTQSSKTAWGQDIPYLTSVESLSDKDNSVSTVTTVFTSDQLKEKLSLTYDDIDFSSVSDADKWIEITSTAQHGYVKSLTVCNKKLSANDFCETLGLPSQCFEINFSQDKFTFTSHGYGHLVGMSQYGADYMAKQGKSCEEILKHYFKGCELSECD